MSGKSIGVTLAIIGLVAVGSYFGYRPVESDSDRVEAAAKGVWEALSAVSTRVPKSSISAYKVVTEDLAKNGAMPNVFKNAAGNKNAWGGNVVVQVFPANAWRPGVSETVNIVLETIPESDCARLVQRLSKLSPDAIFQINVEPSKKTHNKFPVGDDTGCISGLNNIGYTAYAR